MLRPKKIAKCFYKALDDTIRHDGIEHAGYLAFLAILSLFPFLVFFFAIVSFFGQTELGLKFTNLIVENNVIPSSVLPALKVRIEEIASGPPQGLLTIAIIGAIWTASSSVDGLRTILNRAYRVNTPPAYIWRRLRSIVEFLVITALTIAITFILIIAPSIWVNVKAFLHLEEVRQLIGVSELSIAPYLTYIRYVITTLSLFLVVVSLYIIIPNTKQTIKSVAPGAAIVIFAWFVSGYMLSAYLNKFEQVSIIYGSLGGIIAALLFFYITAMIFIYGAEFNYRLEKALGHKIEEKE